MLITIPVALTPGDVPPDVSGNVPWAVEPPPEPQPTAKSKDIESRSKRIFFITYPHIKLLEMTNPYPLLLEFKYLVHPSFPIAFFEIPL
jgi:hypothetical protein